MYSYDTLNERFLIFIRLGWSMLQGGLLPSFMHDSLINKMFGPLAPEELKIWKNNFMMVSADLALSRNILQNHEQHNINSR